MNPSPILDLSVSLVSFNQLHDLQRLLPSLLPATNDLASEILLVDNRSSDGSLAYFEENLPAARTLFNPHRAGYGENHNLNLARAHGRYFVIMNTDMTIEPATFRILTRFMDEHPEVGIVSPKILNEDRTIQGLNKRYPTVLDLSLRRILPASLRPLFRDRLDYYEMRDVGYNHVYDVPFLSGAFMFCRTDLLRVLGGFDPEYFLYFEDVDLCRRVQRTHRTVYCPEVAVIHFWQRAAHKNWRYTYYFIKSAIRYFGQWGYQFS